MGKRATRKIMAWLMLVAMVFTLDLTAVFAAEDVTDKLDIISLSATQNDVDIEGLDKLAFDKPIHIELKFKVPVIGDGISDDQAVHKGNTATIELAKGFKVTFKGSSTLKQGDDRVGTLTLVTTGTGKDAIVTAEIVFDGDDKVFNGHWDTVICTLNATLEYDGPGSENEEKEYTVEILEKEYTVSVPPIPVTLTGKKTGVRDGQFIDWKVQVTAGQDGTSADMSGYRFSDDLTKVGEYVVGSFKVGTTDDPNAATLITPDENGNELSYTFPGEPDVTIGTRYIFFRTEIPSDMLYSNADETITNTAKVYDGEIEKFSEDADVRFKFELIKKIGATTSFDAVANTGHITWTITANQGGASLAEAVITDVLSRDLEWESATYQIKSGDSWVAHPSITFPSEPTAGKYELGNINTPVQLTIVAKVKDGVNIGHTVQNINNSATISWAGKGGIGSGPIGVNIGLNPISKKAGTPNTSTHTIPWTVSVQKSDVNVDLYVLDLLVYADSCSWSNVASHAVSEGTAAGLSVLTLADIKDRAPTARYNQKYVASSFATTHELERVVYTLKNSDGKAIADLLVVTGTGGSTINTSTTQIFTFDSVITNPDIYAKNATTTIRNTATLYSANTWLNEATDSVSYTSRMLAKDMLSRAHAANPDTNKNGAGAGTGAGYDYVNHTVVFRLHVNANNIENFTNDLTTVDGISVGTVTLTDTLPEGWEFVDIETDTKFVLYKGTPGTGGKVTAGDRITFPTFVTADFDTPGKAVFTFTTLTEPYVILVKAGPTEETIRDYFSENKTYDPTNTATLQATNWIPGEKVTQKVEIKSQIIDKNLVAGSGDDQGVITWTVNYRPNELEHEGAVIKDELDVGLDLRTGADGKLMLDGNITAQEMTLNPDGSYSKGATVTLVQDEGPGQNISYDPETRVLQFNIPDSTQAYRLVYKTDVTANAGTMLRNEVELAAGGNKLEGDRGGYTVVNADGWNGITRLMAMLLPPTMQAALLLLTRLW